jgi:hypothetical protein
MRAGSHRRSGRSLSVIALHRRDTWSRHRPAAVRPRPALPRPRAQHARTLSRRPARTGRRGLSMAPEVRVLNGGNSEQSRATTHVQATTNKLARR